MNKKFKRVPKHIGVIPDGNRRWAVNNNKQKEEGYAFGVEPGVILFNQLVECGVEEVTFYGFTKDNNNRPNEQSDAYIKSCVDAVNAIANKDASIMVLGNTDSKMFPKELLPYANKRVKFGKGIIKANFLCNYDWNWDLLNIGKNDKTKKVSNDIHSKEISRIDLIIRWGGRRRLSGFLPVQSVYSDFYVVEDLWPDFKEMHFVDAMNWYQDCDVTLGG